MKKTDEKTLYLEMLSELISTRRALTEEILLVRTRLTALDDEVKQESEYMSAESYITLRHNIKRELEKDMREQIKREVEIEHSANQVAVPDNTKSNMDIAEFFSESSSVIPPEVVAEAKYQDNKKMVRKDVSVPVLCNVVIRILKEYGRPMELNKLKAELEADRNNFWKPKSWSQLVWKIKQEEPKLVGAGRGYIQYISF